jgi:hypothetical protein
MDAGTLSVRKIFGQDRRHVVPLFQRPYVWEREKQWEPFWEDIRALAERLACNQEPRPHFLGAIVLDQMPTATGHVETRQVIDGQQRLTTLQIFLEAFCDLCGDQGFEKHHKALLKLTRNDDPMSEDEDEEFKVWPTNTDQAHFRRVMRCASPVELRKQYEVKANAAVGHPIADGYLFFHVALGEWLGVEGEMLEERLDALFNAARDYIRLVVIDLDKEDDAQLIFETLNARGTPLLPSDLVKNFLFHRAQLVGEPVEPLYQGYWRFFDEDPKYWRRELGRGHARRHRIDTYLQHYLTLQTRDEVPVAHLYVVFREFARQNGSPQKTLATIKQYADVYRSFDCFAPGCREALFFERVAAMDITTAYPFLMQLFAEFGSQQKVLHAVLADVESFLVRRMVCQLNTRGYNRLFLDMLKTLGQDGDATVSAVRQFLLSSAADSNRWPPDAEFKQAWLDYPLYRNLAQRRVRLLLEALERKLRTGKSEKMQLEEKLTIEHLLPQDWRKHWPLPDEAESELAEQERDRSLHTVGNLTLLNGKLNPTVSNGPWDKKRPEILKHSLLRMNHELGEYPAWDEACIRLRGEKLFELATSIWPRPTQTVEQPESV